VETNPQGACMVYEQTWQCRVASGTTSTVTNCGSQQFCIDGQCFDTSHAPDADFARAVAGLEVQREAGRYLDPNTLEVFKGYDNRCRKKLFGLVNCCKGGGTERLAVHHHEPDQRRRRPGHRRRRVELHLRRPLCFRRARPGDRRLRGALQCRGGGSSALAGLIAG
jgi:conjugal transfer mating pair stabilization protein TraN